MPKRKQISKRVRFEIFKRDEFKCQYCGATPPNAVLHVDHIQPVANDGTNDTDNLITSCSVCNLGKGARSLDQIPKSLKEKAKEIEEIEAQIIGYNNVIQDKKERIENECWEVIEIISPASLKEGFHRSKFLSVKNFIEKLGLHEVLDSAEKTISKDFVKDYITFKYFCGICWRKIKGD